MPLFRGIIGSAVATVISLLAPSYGSAQPSTSLPGEDTTPLNQVTYLISQGNTSRFDVGPLADEYVQDAISPFLASALNLESGSVVTYEQLQTFLNDLTIASRAEWDRGLGGLYLSELLNAFPGPQPGEPAAKPHWLFVLRGKIVDWSFTLGPKDGSNYTGTGMITVETYITVIRQVPGQGTPPPRTTALRWKISVPNDGFVVEKRATPPGDLTSQPFPAAAQALDLFFPLQTIARVDAFGFDAKLWVRGNNIVVDEIRRSQNWPTAPFTVLNKNSPQFKKYYEPSPSNCIDMMIRINWTTAEPVVPTTYQELTHPAYYCLGRCDMPKIINTM